MTNAVFNRCRIEGSEAGLDAFERIALTDPPGRPSALQRLFGRGVRHTKAPRTLDAERILPVPKGLDPNAAAAWRTEHWGVRSAPEPRGYERSGPEAELTFYTPYAAPVGVLRALAERLPDDVALTCEHVEPGNAYAGRIRVANGAVREEELPFTREFHERVTGEALDEDW